MSIFEYDEEEHMRQEREQFWNKGMREGRRQGIQEGIQEGLEIGRIQLIQKKLEKGKSISQIAEELESTEEEILAAIEKMKQKGLLEAP